MGHLLEQFQFETLRVSNHTACRFAEKARFFRSLWAGRRCAAASRFTFFKVETLYRAYRQFCGNFVDTGDLRAFDNSFDSRARKPAGHSCNCTFAFMLLERAGLADGIVKRGRRFGTHFLRESVD